MDPSPCWQFPIIDFDDLLLHSSPNELKVAIETDSGAECCQARNERSVDSPLPSSSSRSKDVRVDYDGKSVQSKDTLLLANERRKITAEVMASLGPGGPGLLAVRGMPAVMELRRILLPLAKKLALMPDSLRRPILKEHGLCADVSMKQPDRPASAFATQVQYARHLATVEEENIRRSSILLPHCSKSSSTCCCCSPTCSVGNRRDPYYPGETLVSEEKGLEQLGSLLRKLAACMVEVGLLVARLCDSEIPGAQLEEAMWESGSAKARLIHYHAQAEKDILCKSPLAEGKRGRSRTLSKISTTMSSEVKTEEKSVHTTASDTDTGKFSNPSTASDLVTVSSPDLWQQWHYDYGVFTVLTTPMFLSSHEVAQNTLENEEGSSPHSGLKVLSCSRGGAEFVSFPPDCLIIQVGEVAQILSGGKLSAALHCVCRPPNCQSNFSRETFVTFLQPAWHRVLSPPLGMTRTEVLNGTPSLFQQREGSAGSDELSKRPSDWFSVVPSLDSRWKEDSTFAEFSRETTAQYYGIRGRQSHQTRVSTGF